MCVAVGSLYTLDHTNDMWPSGPIALMPFHGNGHLSQNANLKQPLAKSHFLLMCYTHHTPPRSLVRLSMLGIHTAGDIKPPHSVTSWTQKSKMNNHILSGPCLREYSMLLVLNSNKSNLSSNLEEELPASSQSQYLPLFAPHFLFPKLAPESFLCINSRHCVNTVLRFI